MSSERSIPMGILIGIGLVVLVGGFVVWRTWFGLTETQKIERLVHKAAAAIEDEAALRFVDLLTDDFTAGRHVERDTIMGQLKRFFFQTTDLSVVVKHITHEQAELPATATATRAIVVAAVSGKTDGERFQGIGGKGADALLVWFRKVEGRWRVARAAYLKLEDPLKAFELFR